MRMLLCFEQFNPELLHSQLHFMELWKVELLSTALSLGTCSLHECQQTNNFQKFQLKFYQNNCCEMKRSIRSQSLFE